MFRVIAQLLTQHFARVDDKTKETRREYSVIPANNSVMEDFNAFCLVLDVPKLYLPSVQKTLGKQIYRTRSKYMRYYFIIFFMHCIGLKNKSFIQAYV